jgi:polyhydroxybutyrate depolymerase
VQFDWGKTYQRRGRLRLLPPKYLDRLELEVAGITRTYWLPPGAVADPSRPASAGPAASRDGRPPPPLLLALHGLNSSGSRLAWWSGLGERGPRSGFHCVFPDALGTVWDDHGCGRVDGADDARFIAELIEHAAQTGAADPDRVVVTGVSSGATFAERLVRSGAVAARGLVLVCGTARIASAQTTAISAGGVDVALIAGTGDPILPYAGGPSRGPVGRLAIKQVAATLRDPSGHESVAPESLAAEWVAANGCRTPPELFTLPPTAEGFPVARMVWPPGEPGGPAVTLYRITGGGHGWPSGKQYLPASFLGRIPQGFDATGIALELARATTAVTAAGREH